MHPDRRSVVLAALRCGVLITLSFAIAARADDTPTSCDALKRIVAASPKFSSLTAIDGRPVALSYGDDAQCAASPANYRCTWTRHGGSGADALQSVAADIAACLPDATHDENSHARQHFTIGPRGSRTEIAASQAGANLLKLEIYATR